MGASDTKMVRMCLIAGVLAATIGAAAIVHYQPYIEIGSRGSLSNEVDPAIALLRDGGRLSEIQHQVGERGLHVDDISWRGISFAVEASREDVFKWALEQGADPDGIGIGSSPLVLAIRSQNMSMIRLLLDHGADPGRDIGFGGTPLSVARSKGYDSIVELLLEHVKEDDYR